MPRCRNGFNKDGCVGRKRLPGTRLRDRQNYDPSCRDELLKETGRWKEIELDSHCSADLFNGFESHDDGK